MCGVQQGEFADLYFAAPPRNLAVLGIYWPGLRKEPRRTACLLSVPRALTGHSLCFLFAIGLCYYERVLRRLIEDNSGEDGRDDGKRLGRTHRSTSKRAVTPHPAP